MKTATAPLAIEKHGLGWRVSSATQPGQAYYVNLLGRRQTCTCPGFTYSRVHLPCKHIRACRELLAREKGVSQPRG